VEEEVLRMEMGKLEVGSLKSLDLSSGRRLEIGKKVGGEEKEGREALEEYLLSVILQGFSLTDKLPESKRTDFITPLARAIFEHLEEYFVKHKEFSVSKFVKGLPEELVEAVDRLYLFDLGETVQRERLLVKEMKQTQKRLRLDLLQTKLKSLGQKIKEEEEKNKDTGKLQRQFDQVLKDLKKLNQPKL